MEPRKMVQGSYGDTDPEKRLVDTVGEGEVGTNGESSMETYMLPDANQITSASLPHDTGRTDPALCDNPQGGAVGGGRESQGDGDTRAPMADSR